MSTEPKLKCKHGEGSDCATCAFLDDPRVDAEISALARERDSWKDLYSKERADYQILLTELNTLRAQLRASREDAERYRWFKREYSATWQEAVTGGDGVSYAPCWELRVYLPTCNESQLDAAIDAALQSTPQLAKNEGEKHE